MSSCSLSHSNATTLELRSEKTLGCWSLPSTMLEALYLLISIVFAGYLICELPKILLSPAPNCCRSLDLQICATCLTLCKFRRFPWVLTFARQVLYPLSHFPVLDSVLCFCCNNSMFLCSSLYGNTGMWSLSRDALRTPMSVSMCTVSLWYTNLDSFWDIYRVYIAGSCGCS